MPKSMRSSARSAWKAYGWRTDDSGGPHQLVRTDSPSGAVGYAAYGARPP